LGVALGLGTWIVSVRDRKWGALEMRVDELFKELDAPPLERLPLGRDLLPGNAWDDYTAASAAPADQRARIFAPVSRWLWRNVGANPAEAASLISEFSPRIEMIRKGAWRQSAKPPTLTRTINGVRAPVFQWYGNELLAELCVGKARLLSEAGDPSEALNALVDVCLYGRDLAESREPVGVSSGLRVMEAAFLEIREMLQHQNASPEDLNRLDRALGLLDDHFPDRKSALYLKLFEFGDLLRREDRTDSNLTGYTDPARRRRKWRYGFSTRLEAATAFFAVESLTQRVIALESQPWSVASAGYRALQEEISQYPLLDHRFGFAGYRSTMQTKGHLRLLRVATHFLVSGDVLDLDDPLGGKVRTRPSDKALLIWVRRLYGTPDWEPKEAEHGYGFGLSIEVPQRGR
jgi:hypothetical protein